VGAAFPSQNIFDLSGNKASAAGQSFNRQMPFLFPTLGCANRNLEKGRNLFPGGQFLAHGVWGA
jgi:hypothetical protein